MTAEQLAEIKARADRATPGPWTVNGLEVITGDLIRIADYESLGGSDAEWDQMGHDAEFGAHARQDVPALIAEIERLTTPPVGSNIDHTARLRALFAETITMMAEASTEALAGQVALYANAAIWSAEREARAALDFAERIAAEFEQLRASRPDPSKVHDLINAYRDSNLSDHGLADLIVSLYDEAAS